LILGGNDPAGQISWLRPDVPGYGARSTKFDRKDRDVPLAPAPRPI